MINRDDIINEFIELVRIDSLTFEERKMADILTRKLEEIGIEVYEDDAGKKIEGNSGNLIGTLMGNKEIPPILMMAHMDTVTPGKNKNPIIDGDFIKSDGKTILGGDDLAGIITILEALRIIVREKLEHGDVQVIFTVAEEGGLFGARNLDFSKINAKYGFVFDEGGKIGTVAVSAPSQNKIDISITGKAAHAGVEPEKGISAIQIAAEAISKMKLGRIDEKTTANIGVIYGGQATNIICDRVEINAEARSRDEDLLLKQTEHMKKCFEDAVEKFGGEMKYSSELVYSGFDINESDDIIKIARAAADKAEIDLVLEATGGGSDTNILNSKGIKAINLSCGMQNVHCVEEQISISYILKSIEFAKEIILAV